MANNILPPTSVWENTTTSLPTESEIISSTLEDGIKIDRLRFKGRDINGTRVSIFAVYMHALTDEEDNSAVLLLNDCDKTVDPDLMKYFVKMGYNVLMPDYRGIADSSEDYTIYPEEISYANYMLADRHILYADKNINETSWYEWVFVARYAVKFLNEQGNISNIGAVGIRGGGEIIWKLLFTDNIACGITVNAAGWLAYRGINKFEDNLEINFDDERYRFVCGMDSQAYASLIKNPVLMLCSNHDESFDLDRAYDTFARINKNVEGALYYSIDENGFINEGGKTDIELFLSKYLGGRQVFIPRPVELDIETDEDGELVCVVTLDAQSSVESFGVYCAENVMSPIDREWVAMQHKGTLSDGREIFSLNVCDSTEIVFAFAYAKCTSGFITSSKIVCRRLEEKPANVVARNRIIYSGRENSGGFYIIDYKGRTISDCFLIKEDKYLPTTLNGFGDIRGIYSEYGLITYRIGMGMYAPDFHSVLAFDVYSTTCNKAKLTILKRIGGEIKAYSDYVDIDADNDKWNKIIINAEEFKDKNGDSLDSYKNSLALLFDCSKEKKYIVNNIIWI